MEVVLPALRDRFESAQPFRHVVIDDFLPVYDAHAIADIFPKPLGSDRVLAKLFSARSYHVDRSAVDPRIGRVFEMLGSTSFIAWLEELTGIENLQIDPDFIGAGLHQAVNGSSLPVHADHNTHPNDDTLYRRLNVLIYMNPVWRAEWGGMLELWDRDAAAPTVTIAPLLNRCIIMEVNDRAFHGYRQLRVPDGRPRNALVAYYYSPEPATQQETRPHPTLFPVAGRSRRELLVRRLRHGAFLRIIALRQRLGGSRPKAKPPKTDGRIAKRRS